jgi:hypothetical protein
MYFLRQLSLKFSILRFVNFGQILLQKKLIEQRLSLCRLPVSFSRPLTKLNVDKMKASEVRTWLTHCSSLCLKPDVLPRSYIDHWNLLVASYKVLSGDDIHEFDLQQAKSDLQKFVDQFEILYPTVPLGINMHYLTHLTDMVQKWGPLWNYSLFHFENKNGFIPKHCFTTGNVITTGMMLLLGSQVLKNQSIFVQIPQEMQLLNRICGKR